MEREITSVENSFVYFLVSFPGSLVARDPLMLAGRFIFLSLLASVLQGALILLVSRVDILVVCVSVVVVLR